MTWPSGAASANTSVDAVAAAFFFANNIAPHDLLFRLGLTADLVIAAISLLLTYTLNRLFRDTDRRAALLMLMLGFMDTPLYFFNAVNDMAVLVLAHGATFLSGFDTAQRDGRHAHTQQRG